MGHTIAGHLKNRDVCRVTFALCSFEEPLGGRCPSADRMIVYGSGEQNMWMVYCESMLRSPFRALDQSAPLWTISSGKQTVF
mmetsp:Transcript_2771/g.10955  ORF Transcript_2771/g.10955 Transcript_2771/m.10955 type:complete len:82 (+) Transcript_2771:60-305(+)